LFVRVFQCWRLTGFQCWPCYIDLGFVPCSIPCSPRAVQACLYPSPRGWFHACQGESPGHCPVISAGPSVCCSALCAVSGVVRPEYGGGLGESLFLLTIVFSTALSCACGTSPLPVSHPCQYAIFSLEYPPPKGWCCATGSVVWMGSLFVATMWVCCVLLWFDITCGACCESASRLSVSRRWRFVCFQCWSYICVDMGCVSYPIPCTGLRVMLACQCPSPKGWY